MTEGMPSTPKLDDFSSSKAGNKNESVALEGFPGLFLRTTTDGRRYVCTESERYWSFVYGPKDLHVVYGPITVHGPQRSEPCEVRCTAEPMRPPTGEHLHEAIERVMDHMAKDVS